MEDIKLSTTISGTTTSLKSEPIITQPSPIKISSSAVTEENYEKINPSKDRSSTIIESSTYAEGWVDKAKILTTDEFIQKLKANLK